MNSYVYILLCRDGSYYTGSTNNIERRLSEHQSGCGANYTSKRLPIELVYYEEFLRIDDAFYREKQIQGWSKKKKEALINNKPKELPLLSKNYTQFPRDSHFDTSTGSVSSELVVEQFDKLTVSPIETTNNNSHFDKLNDQTLVPELVEGTNTNVKTTRGYGHFDRLNDQILVPELVEGTDTNVEGTNSHFDKLNDHKTEKLEK
ncbi:MAG: GIY-YIG nuclease family protein [Chitinophagales bacterium]|nr:GIY-YIG nuclease family protein [Chitinophagales bacterium]